MHLATWVRVGQKLDDFWSYSWAEIDIIVRASVVRDERQAWLGARYTAWAYHEPNNIPADPALPRVKSRQEIEADQIAVRQALIGMANRSKKHG